MHRSPVARLLTGSGALLLATSIAGLTGCGGSSTTSTSPTSASGATSAPTSVVTSAAGSTGGSAGGSGSAGAPSTTSGGRGSSGGAGAATSYPGGTATVEINAVSDVLNWQGTLTGTCAENRFAKFPVDIRATDAAGVKFESHPSLPGRGTFEMTDSRSVPRMEGTLITFPAAAGTTGATTRYSLPEKTSSVSDSTDYTITFDNDEATSGTQVLKRFRYPTTKVNTGTITVRWTCT